MPLSALAIGGIAAAGIYLLGRKKEGSTSTASDAIKFVSDPEAKLGPNMAKPVTDPATGSVVGVTAVDDAGTSYTKLTDSERTLIEPGFCMEDEAGNSLGCSDSLGREISEEELNRRVNEASRTYAPDLVY